MVCLPEKWAVSSDIAPDNVFCQFAASHFDFYLILRKTNVSVYFRVSYPVFRIHVWRNSLYLFSFINCAVNLYLTENMFWVFGNYSESCEPWLTKNSNSASRCKIRCFNLHNNENMFWFVGNKIRLL